MSHTCRARRAQNPRQRGELAREIAIVLALGLGTTGLVSFLHSAPAGQAVEPFRPLDAGAALVLLVDDDENEPDVRGFYVDALEDLGVGFEVWDTGAGGHEPARRDLEPYGTVIWFTGGASTTTTGPGPDAEEALSAWLRRDRRLLVSSQDYHWARGGTTRFMSSKLGVEGIEDDIEAHRTVTGESSPFDGWGPYPLVFDFEDYADVVRAGPAATVALRGAGGAPMGVISEAAGARAVFLGFPLEVVSPHSAGRELLARFLDRRAERGGPEIFSDGFESGNFNPWSKVEPPPPCEITVTSPGDGDSWAIGSTETIRWTSIGDCTSDVAIRLRQAGADVWVVATATANDGAYAWTIPAGVVPANDYRIRVEEVGNGAQGDSDGTFAITWPSPTPSATATMSPTSTATIPPTPTATLTPSPTATIGPTPPA